MENSEIESKEVEDLKDDAIQQSMGGFGKYQILLVLFYFPCKIPTALHPLGIVFLAPPVKYMCMDNIDNVTKGIPDKCPCENPVYDTSIFQETIITTWDLICEREWMVSFNQTLFMLGILVGSIVFGAISDRFGRRLPLLGAVTLELVAGVASSFTPEFWSFSALRFLIGTTVGGILIVSFVLLLEFTGKKYRELASSLTQLPFNTGYVLLPILGYYFRTWQNLQFLFSISAAALIFIFWFLPESPRWLLTVGRTDEAIAVITKVAIMNNRPTEDIINNVKLYQRQKAYESVQKGTVLDLFKTPNIRKNIICMSINWVVCSFGFFGVSQYIGQLNGNIFINISISAALNVIATFVIYLMTKYMKRRSALLVLNIGTTVCLFAIAVIPKSGNIAKVVLACLGNLGMFVAFIVVYLYSTELFPTVVRNVAIGVSSMLARVGSMVAPFVITLGSTALWLPPVVFGIAPLIAAGLCLLLPETKGCNLMDTLSEGENFSKKQKSADPEGTQLKVVLHQ